jgi:dTMP kinase
LAVAVLRPERRSGDDDPDAGEPAPASTDPVIDLDMPQWRDEQPRGFARPAPTEPSSSEPRREPVTPTGHRPTFAPAADPAADPTETIGVPAPNDRVGWHVRLFGSPEFFRLWLVQVVSATGDWLGLAATIAFTSSLYAGEASSAAAISAVVAVRLIPGFLFGPVVGVLVDRWDRKKTMMAADLSRAAILVCVPFVRNLAGLIVASLLLEVFSLLWNPSKEAIVPHLVPQEHLTTANSLSMGAAFGTAPIAQLLFALLAGISAWLAHIGSLGFLALNQTALAFFFDAGTFVFAAAMIWRLDFPRRARRAGAGTDGGGGSRSVAWDQTFRELKEGWQYVFINHTVRAVNLGLSVALIGGGMLIPLGAVFASTVLGAGAAGYGLFTTALMFGVAGGIITVSAFQRRLPQARAFIAGLFVAGTALFCAASSSRLGVSVVFVFVMGFATGPVYVLGFSMLHAEVEDQLRGRVFGALDTLIRFCVLAGLVVGPLLATVLGEASNALVGGELTVGSASIAVPGVRLALWLDAAIIIGAGFIARQSIRSSRRLQETSMPGHPANPTRGDR